MITNVQQDDSIVTSYAKAPTRTVTVGGTTFAYRELGPKGGIPVVFFVHLAATLDNWDPRIVDRIAQDRHVITFDNKGVGASTGEVPDTVEAMADDAYAFITALGFDKIDIFSFSLGGFDRPGPGRQAPRPRPQARPDRHRSAWRQGHRQGRRHHLLGHPACDPDAVGPQGVPVLQPQRHRQARRQRRSSSGCRSAPSTVTQKITLKAFRTQLKAITQYGRSAPRTCRR